MIREFLQHIFFKNKHQWSPSSQKDKGCKFSWFEKSGKKPCEEIRCPRKILEKGYAHTRRETNLVKITEGEWQKRAGKNCPKKEEKSYRLWTKTLVTAPNAMKKSFIWKIVGIKIMPDNFEPICLNVMKFFTGVESKALASSAKWENIEMWQDYGNLYFDYARHFLLSLD